MPPRSVPPPEKLVFLFGHPVAHSLSPAMHDAAFRELGMPYRYAALDVLPGSVEGAVELLRLPGTIGANVTVPHKEAVIPFLDRVDADARWLRSVNTITRKGRRLVGSSTDGPGFLRSLGGEARRLKGATAVLVGAGGGARAVAGALLAAGTSRILVTDVDAARARGLVRLLRSRRRGFDASAVDRREAEKVLDRAGIVVQATPVGLHGRDPSPLSLSRACRGSLAVDLVYHRRTRFLEDAARRGMRTLSGLGMLLHQGALSFGSWTGRKAPVHVMERALRKVLRRTR